MAWSQTELDVCQEAFYLLRQDVDVPTAETADSDTTTEWKKCAKAYRHAKAEVLAAHEWTWARTEEPALDKWPQDVRNALVYCVARELAIPLAGRIADMQNMDALYRDKLVRARVRDLDGETTDDAVTKEVVAALRPHFAADDKRLPRSVAAIHGRVASVKDASLREVKDAFAGWTWASEGEMDGLARAAYVALVCEKLAIPCGLDASVAESFEKIYQTKLQRAVVAAVNAAVDSEEDALAKAVLAAIRAAYGMDDQKLPNSVAGLSGRVAAVARIALDEVRAAYPWSGVTPETAWDALPGLVKAAYVATVAANVAVGLGLDAQAATTLEQKKALALAQAKKSELDAALAKNDDPVLAQLVPNFKADDSGLAGAYAIYTRRAAAVKAGSEDTVRDLLGLADGAALAGAAKDAAVALSVAKLAPVCGLDASFANLKEQEFNSLVADFRKTALDADIASGEASAGEMKRCCDEVRATLEIPEGTALDPVALGAAAALCFSRAAARTGYDANFATVKAQEHAAKIAEWRKIALNRALAKNDDPILAELLANFRSDDAGLANAYAVYVQRVSAVRLAAFEEIARTHDWQWIDAAWTDATPLDEKVAAMDGLSRSAYVALVVRQLAVSCGIAPEMAQVYEQQYQTRLRAARVADLETTPVDDEVQREVLALSRDTFAGDGALPRDMKTLTDRIDRLKGMARKEVLAAHDWSFAEADFACDAAETEYPDEIFPWHVTLPKGCLLVSACYGEDGKVAQWKLRGREVHAQSRLVRIVYVRDVEDFAAWHPKAYRAFVLRLVADVAKSVASSPKDRTFQEQLYRDALEEAKTCDARSSNAPDEAWGDNEIADTMLNGYGRRRYDDPLARD